MWWGGGWIVDWFDFVVLFQVGVYYIVLNGVGVDDCDFDYQIVKFVWVQVWQYVYLCMVFDLKYVYVVVFVQYVIYVWIFMWDGGKVVVFVVMCCNYGEVFVDVGQYFQCKDIDFEDFQCVDVIFVLFDEVVVCYGVIVDGYCFGQGLFGQDKFIDVLVQVVGYVDYLLCYDYCVLQKWVMGVKFCFVDVCFVDFGVL